MSRVVRRRQQFEDAVRLVLENAAEGRLRDLREFEFLDFKEEAGRRSGPDIKPGGPQNQAAAIQMADEVACFANTPGGGVFTSRLGEHDAVTTGDLMTLTGVSRGTVKKLLDGFVEAGDLVLRGAGRSTRYEEPVP